MNSIAFGANGTYINNTTTTAPASNPFTVINALVDCTVVLAGNWINGLTPTVVMVAGQTIYGVFTSVQTSGTVVAYK